MTVNPILQKSNLAWWFVLAVCLGSVILQILLLTAGRVDTIPFSEFQQLVAQGKVSTVDVGTSSISGTVKGKLPSGNTEFVTIRVDPALATALGAKGITVKGEPSGGLLETLFSWILPALLFGSIW